MKGARASPHALIQNPRRLIGLTQGKAPPLAWTSSSLHTVSFCTARQHAVWDRSIFIFPRCSAPQQKPYGFGSPHTAEGMVQRPAGAFAMGNGAEDADAEDEAAEEEAGEVGRGEEVAAAEAEA